MKAGLILWLAAVGSVVALPAFADTIVITRGFVPVSSPFSGEIPPFGFELFGDKTEINGETFASGIVSVTVGDVVDLSTTVTPSFVNHPLLQTVNGNPVEAFLDGRLDFAAKPFIVSAPSRDLMTPFTMTGMISGFGNAEHSGAPLFTLALKGGGTASVSGLRAIGGGNFFVTGGTAFMFSAPPTSPTPEPSTLPMLMGALVFAVRSPFRRLVTRFSITFQAGRNLR